MAKKEKEAKKIRPEEAEEITQDTEQEETEDNNDTPEEKTELEKLSDQFIRTAAEYDNYRKRTARERIELEADIKAKVMTEILPTLDNLERALSADCADENYKKGIEMIYGSFLEVLKNLGVEETDEEEFNPAVHQAVQKVSDENFKSGEITKTFQKGYRIGEKVIRFAMVAVNE